MRSLRPIGPWIVAWLALAVAAAVLSWPAMTGTWVYDDVTMLDHPLMDDAGDIAAVWGHTSSDFLTPGDEGLESGYTWRPLTMVTLIAVHVVSDQSAFAHHVASWGLHALVLAILLGAAARARGRIDAIALGAVGALALHPAPGEAWLWINGRSDLVSAVGVALAGLAVTPHRDGRPFGPMAAVAFGCAALVGALGKEVALPAAGAIAVAAALPPKVDLVELTREPRRVVGLAMAAARRVWPLVVALVVVALVWRTGRISAAEETGSFAGVSLASVIARTPLALALAGETLIAPVPRPMRSLAWEFFVGWTPGRIATFAAMVAILVATIARGRLRSTVLLLGAAATIAPVTLVADFDWLGLDRYLYVPMVLAILAVVWDAPRVELSTLRRPMLAVGGVVGLALGAALFGQAGVYAGHGAWVRAMVDLQPENPSGHVKFASWQASRGDMAAAAERLEGLIDDDMPAAIRHGAAQVALQVGRGDIAAAHVDAAWRDAPGDPTVQLDVLMLRAAQHRWDDVVTLSGPLLDLGLTCNRTRLALREWLDAGVVPPTHSDALTTAFDSATCP